MHQVNANSLRSPGSKMTHSPWRVRAPEPGSGERSRTAWSYRVGLVFRTPPALPGFGAGWPLYCPASVDSSLPGSSSTDSAELSRSASEPDERASEGISGSDGGSASERDDGGGPGVFASFRPTENGSAKRAFSELRPRSVRPGLRRRERKGKGKGIRGRDASSAFRRIAGRTSAVGFRRSDQNPFRITRCCPTRIRLVSRPFVRFNLSTGTPYRSAIWLRTSPRRTECTIVRLAEGDPATRSF